MTRIVCLSDTHNFNEQIVVPDGDVLVHAGDATNRGEIDETKAFCNWFLSLPHKHKIFVAGNHDWLFEKQPETARNLMYEVNYLQDSFVEIEDLKFYGSPWQPWFFDWAFQFKTMEELAEKWRQIPKEIDVLITHGPPFGILDETPRGNFAGCEELRKRVEEVRPKLHIFGHIHHGYGTIDKFGVQFANASICNENYEPTNLPLVFDL